MESGRTMATTGLKKKPDVALVKEQNRSILILILILLPGLACANLFDGFWRYFLCMPSARICSLFFGSDCIATSEGYMLTNKILQVHVTKTCSASSFLILLLALISVAVIHSFRIRELLKILWVIPVGYIIAISANTTRIISAWITGRFARATLPENFWPGVHLGTGVVVFLTFLIAVYLFLKWRQLNEYRQTSNC